MFLAFAKQTPATEPEPKLYRWRLGSKNRFTRADPALWWRWVSCAVWANSGSANSQPTRGCCWRSPFQWRWSGPR